MPTLHSHTHCQVAQANAQTKTWQRVCLSHRTTKTTDKSTDKKNTEPLTAVTVAQLFFLENSFQKNKILTSLEAILERFVFKTLKFRALTMVFFML